MRTDTRPTLLTWVYGIALALLLGIAGIGMDGPSAQEEAADTAGAVQDGEQASAQLQADYLFALHREQAERPGLWTPEQIARGDVAARIVAHTRKEAP